METELMTGRLAGRALGRQEYAEVRSAAVEPQEPPLTVMAMDLVARAQADLSEALSVLWSLHSRLFGPSLGDPATSSGMSKAAAVRDELPDRLYGLGSQSDAVLSMARTLNERI